MASGSRDSKRAAFFSPRTVLLNKRSYEMKKFFKDESGATAIEYGLIAAAMGLALVTAMPSITRAVITEFTSIGGNLTTPPV